MFQNFFKTTLRNLLKNKSYVIINILGLSLALACCIIAFLNYKFAKDYDINHLNRQRIYKIEANKMVQNQLIPYGITPLPLGDGLSDQLPEVELSCRYTVSRLVIKREEKVFTERLAFAESGFFEMFTFPVKYGSLLALENPGQIILSEACATKLFGDTNPVGEFVTVVKNDGNLLTKIVGAVVYKEPMNSSIHFGGLMHFDSYADFGYPETNPWGAFIAATFIMTKTQDPPKEVLNVLNDRYIQVQNDARDDWKIASYYLQPLATLAANGEYIRANWLVQAPPKPAIIVPMVMAILMLLIACFNFTNTSIAISSKRMKEIGIRKVLGGNKRQLIVQFMGENLLLTFVSLIGSLLLAFYLVPAYSAMWDFIDIKLDLIHDPEIYGFLIVVLVFTSLVAGLYPSFVIAGYQPVKILKGNLTLGRTSAFSKILLSSQYTLTVIALIASLAFAQNAAYQKQLDVGFEKENVISVRVGNVSEFDRLNQMIQSNPSIIQVAQTKEHLGMWNYGRTLKNEGLEIEAGMMDLGLNYKEVMDIQLVDGRWFQPDLYEHDLVSSLIVNEQLVKEFGWEKPVGQIVQIDDSTRLQVIGVIKNMHMFGFWDKIGPNGYRAAPKEQTNFAVVRVAPGQLKSTYDFLEKAWYEVEPNKPFAGQYQDEFIKDTELVNNNITVMFGFLGLLALVLSSIGLFTLVSLNIIKRIKEIGVRKVLGATIFQVIAKINLQFVYLLIVSMVFGGLLAYLAIDALMGEVFAYYKVMSLAVVCLPIGLLTIVAVFTSVSRTWAAAKRNPVDSLRYE